MEAHGRLGGLNSASPSHRGMAVWKGGRRRYRPTANNRGLEISAFARVYMRLASGRARHTAPASGFKTRANISK